MEALKDERYAQAVLYRRDREKEGRKGTQAAQLRTASAALMAAAPSFQRGIDRQWRSCHARTHLAGGR